MQRHLLHKTWHAVLSGRGVLALEGRDTHKLLQGLVTCDVTALEEGAQPQHTAFLAHNGRMLFDAFLIPGPADSVLIDAEAAAIPALAAHLRRYKLRSKVTFTDRTADWQGLRVFYDEVFFPYMIGGLIPGVIAGCIAYYLSVPVIRAFRPGAEALQLRPVLEVPGVHQSGVNALHLCTLCPPGVDSPGQGGVRFSVASGGDDQAVHVKVCCMSPAPGPWDPSGTALSVAVVNAFSEERAHGSAVRGVWVEGDLLISGGRDQRVRFWRLQDGGLSLRGEAVLDVGNMCAMDVISDPRPTPGGSLRHHVIACGRGMQALSFDDGWY